MPESQEQKRRQRGLDLIVGKVYKSAASYDRNVKERNQSQLSKHDHRNPISRMDSFYLLLKLDMFQDKRIMLEYIRQKVCVSMQKSHKIRKFVT